MDGVGYEYAVTIAEHPRRRGLQQFHIAVECDGETTAPIGAGSHRPLAEEIARRFRMEYRYTPVVHILPLGTVPRTWGKAKRICSPEEFMALIMPYVEGNS